MFKRTFTEYSTEWITHISLGMILLLLPLQALNASPFELNITDPEKLESYIAARDQLIQKEPQNPIPYIERGDARFLAHEFDGAVEDYTAALKIDDSLDDAYFGRGVALARAGWVKDGIEDLDIFIKRNPKSSIAFTKRGVRYIWLGDEDKARADFETALKLDPMNAEAHDDLGVLLAKKKLYIQAADHFTSAFKIDPTYQKAYYNMALISYITDSNQQALMYVNNSLKLLPGSRNAMILKSKILESLGRTAEAEVIMEEAEFLPQGNWSERTSLN